MKVTLLPSVVVLGSIETIFATGATFEGSKDSMVDADVTFRVSIFRVEFAPSDQAPSSSWKLNLMEWFPVAIYEVELLKPVSVLDPVTSSSVPLPVKVISSMPSVSVL